MNAETLARVKTNIDAAKKSLTLLKEELDKADLAGIKSPLLDQHRQDYNTLKVQVERMVQVYGG